MCFQFFNLGFLRLLLSFSYGTSLRLSVYMRLSTRFSLLEAMIDASSQGIVVFTSDFVPIVEGMARLVENQTGSFWRSC